MKKHLTVGITIAAIIAMVIVLIAINRYRTGLQAKLTNDIYNQLSELSDNNASNIELKINDQLEMLRLLSAHIENEDLASEHVVAMMNETVDTYGFLRCAITFPDGTFVTHDKKTDGSATNDEFLSRGMKGISGVTGPQPAVVDPSKNVILLTVPITENGKVKALLSGTYETKNLDSAFQMTRFDGKGYSYITAADGNIISAPLSSEAVYDGTNILDFLNSHIIDKSERELIAKNMLEKKNGSLRLKTNEIEKYVSYQPIGINNWYIFSIVSAEVLEIQITSATNDVYQLSFIIVFIFLFLILAVSYFVYAIQRKAKHELTQLAYYDRLTGIANQYLFEKEARRILDNTTNKYAYIILDVNKFKLVNDTFGFAQGDLLLQHIANVINVETEKNEISARFDADAFHILSLYSEKGKLEERMHAVAQKINVFNFDGSRAYHLSVGFGVYVIESTADEINIMGDRARMALSKIKGLYSASVYFYNSAIIDQICEEQRIENTMQSALNNGELTLYLQPKYSTFNHDIRGAEALVRWIHPTKGMLPPDSFIPIFERNGFIVKLDIYMVECVCKKLREWQDKGMPTVPISVNQSRRCLYHSSYIEELTDVLERYDISPSMIELEIIENAFFEDTEALVKIIQKLHDLGFLVAMDDFGSGYSSLNMLQDVIVDVLKIDKNFFKESINSERGKKIVSNVVSMANDLSIEIVAEGIETKEQLDFLKSINCGLVQGFYFSKAIDTIAFEKLLAADRLLHLK